MNPLSLNLAYKFVAFMLMLGEANSFCRRTGLEPQAAYNLPAIRDGSHVGPATSPEIGGSVLTEKYFFGFGRGHLANFYQRAFKTRGGKSVQTWNIELSQHPSLLDTNSAYEMATNWLGATGIDLPALEAKYRRSLLQWRFYPEGPEGPAVLLPVYQVEWKGQILRRTARESAVVSVTVWGTKKEVVEHHVLDDTLFSRAALRIKEADALLTIADVEFQRLGASQKNDLVTKFGFTNLQAGRLVFPDGTREPKKDRAP